MFSRTLFMIDFSPCIDALLAHMPDLKPAGLREVVLLSVIRSSDVPLPANVNRDSPDCRQRTLGRPATGCARER